MKITFLGHAALLIEHGSFKGLIDPFLTGNPVYTPVEEHITEITHILITHGHGDHVGDALSIARNNNALIIANAELASVFKRKDNTLRVHAMHIGGAFTFDFGRVKMTPAVHGSSYHDEEGVHDGGNPGGFLLAIDGIKVYHSGDTGLIYDMKLLADENIDIAFLPIGGNYTMDVIDAAKAVSFINPNITVPIHYNTFPLIKANPTDFVDALPNHKVALLNPGESIQVG